MQLIADTEALYRRYHRMVYLYLLRLSGAPDMAEDLLQETFYRAIRGAAGYRGEASPATWLCAIARRLYLSQAARSSREGARRSEVDWRLIEDPEADPERAVIQRQAIQRALAGLPEQQRVALLLRDADGLSYEEIADAMGLTLANVKVTIHRARVRFRALYAEEGSPRPERCRTSHRGG
jgi:RNA polymerase sigma factor (sigma-70 family)